MWSWSVFQLYDDHSFTLLQSFWHASYSAHSKIWWCSLLNSSGGLRLSSQSLSNQETCKSSKMVSAQLQTHQIKLKFWVDTSVFLLSPSLCRENNKDFAHYLWWSTNLILQNHETWFFYKSVIWKRCFQNHNTTPHWIRFFSRLL